MMGYLRPTENTAGTIPIDTRTAVYRDPNDGQAIVAEKTGCISSLGVSDITVSRKAEDGAPIVLIPQPECIEIRNNGNSNGLVVETEGDRQQIQEGFSARIKRDAHIKVGYQTEFRLTVEREAREEYVIEGDVETDGDLVMGDQQTTNVDKRTSVEDVVAKELDVSGETPAEVKDAVAGEINVGTGDTGDGSDGSSTPAASNHSHTSSDTTEQTTQKVCPVHQIPYSGPTCPKCDSMSDPSAVTSDADTGSKRDVETKFCLFCGEEISARAQVCPACGKKLPDK